MKETDKNKIKKSWFYFCVDHQIKHEFNGIFVMKWSDNCKILVVKEYASSLPRYDPFQ